MRVHKQSCESVILGSTGLMAVPGLEALSNHHSMSVSHTSWDDALFRLPSAADLVPLDVQLLTPQLAAAFGIPYTGPDATGSQSTQQQLQQQQHQPGPAQLAATAAPAVPYSRALPVQGFNVDAWEAQSERQCCAHVALPHRPATQESHPAFCLQSTRRSTCIRTSSHLLPSSWRPLTRRPDQVCH